MYCYQLNVHFSFGATVKWLCILYRLLVLILPQLKLSILQLKKLYRAVKSKDESKHHHILIFNSKYPKYSLAIYGTSYGAMYKRQEGICSHEIKSFCCSHRFACNLHQNLFMKGTHPRKFKIPNIIIIELLHY